MLAFPIFGGVVCVFCSNVLLLSERPIALPILVVGRVLECPVQCERGLSFWSGRLQPQFCVGAWLAAVCVFASFVCFTLHYTVFVKRSRSFLSPGQFGEQLVNRWASDTNPTVFLTSSCSRYKHFSNEICI